MKSYLITSQSFYTDKRDRFREKLQTQLQKHQPEFALFRDKETAYYESLAQEFLDVCAAFKGTKAFLHRDIELAMRLNATGVHLSSDMFGEIATAKHAGLEVVVSTHTLEDVLFAQNAGADYVTYSPIFASPNKGEPKGVEDLKALLEKVDIKVFALGGIINEEQINAVNKAGAFGFASIRYFY
jgi:thiamine-phosphate pyrophosphorylase